MRFLYYVFLLLLTSSCVVAALPTFAKSPSDGRAPFVDNKCIDMKTPRGAGVADWDLVTVSNRCKVPVTVVFCFFNKGSEKKCSNPGPPVGWGTSSTIAPGGTTKIVADVPKMPWSVTFFTCDMSNARKNGLVCLAPGSATKNRPNDRNGPKTNSDTAVTKPSFFQGTWEGQVAWGLFKGALRLEMRVSGSKVTGTAFDLKGGTLPIDGSVSNGTLTYDFIQPINKHPSNVRIVKLSESTISYEGTGDGITFTGVLTRR